MSAELEVTGRMPTLTIRELLSLQQAQTSATVDGGET